MHAEQLKIHLEQLACTEPKRLDPSGVIYDTPNFSSNACEFNGCVRFVFGLRDRYVQFQAFPIKFAAGRQIRSRDALFLPRWRTETEARNAY